MHLWVLCLSAETIGIDEAAPQNRTREPRSVMTGLSATRQEFFMKIALIASLLFIGALVGIMKLIAVSHHAEARSMRDHGGDLPDGRGGDHR